ncbi:MAG: cytosine permease [Ekhidna sp.]|nr:cytosine permease [Ekhidna sp.]
MENNNYNTKWYSLATVFFGGIVSVPALLIGSSLIGSLRFETAITAGFIGFTLVVFFMSLVSIAGVEKRKSSVSLAASGFGKTGARIIVGFVVGMSTLGWFGIQSNIAGASFAEIVRETWEIQIPVWISSVFWGMIMSLSGVFGFKLLRWLNYIAVPAIILLLIYGLFLVFQEHDFVEVLSYVPESEMTLIQAIGLTIGFISVAIVIAPDYNRFAATKRDAVLGTLLGVLPSAFPLLGIGALLAITQETHNIVKIFSDFGFPLFAMTILILATWTSNVMNIYSSGLAFTMMFDLRSITRSRVTLIVSIVGLILAAIGILEHFMGFIGLLTTTVTPVAGVIIADHFLVKRKNNEEKAFNWRGTVSWGSGVLIMFVMDLSVKYMLGIVVSALVYYALSASIKSGHSE